MAANSEAVDLVVKKIIHRIGSSSVALVVGYFAFAIVVALVMDPLKTPTAVVFTMGVVVIQAARQTFGDLRVAWRR